VAVEGQENFWGFLKGPGEVTSQGMLGRKESDIDGGTERRTYL
jgi:hypothetical protein